ncbi:MAG: hypothetical protein ACI9WU_002230 [Myxococcota bacterium]|jgi:hypothetical protein
MRQSPTELRHEPVACVVTVVCGEHGQVHVLEIARGDAALTRTDDTGVQQFADVTGSIVWIGSLTAGNREVEAAIIYELPEGRLRASGTVRIKTDARGRASLTANADDGNAGLRLTAICQPHLGADAAPATRKSS